MEIPFVPLVKLLLPNALDPRLDACQLGEENAIFVKTSKFSPPTLPHRLLQSHQLLLQAGQKQ